MAGNENGQLNTDLIKGGSVKQEVDELISISYMSCINLGRKYSAVENMFNHF